MPDDPAVYVERYRWTPTIMVSIAADLVFVVLAVFFIAPLLVRIPVLATFGWFAVVSIAGVLSRKVALRVDEAGVTFGGGPFRYDATTRVHRWEDIEAITFWQRYTPVTIGRWTPFSLGPIRCIGFRRRPGAPPITPGGRAGRTGRRSWLPSAASQPGRHGTSARSRSTRTDSLKRSRLSPRPSQSRRQAP